MRGAMGESVPPAAATFDHDAWLTVALREQERRAGAPRAGAVARYAAGPVAEPCIDRAACAAWLAVVPARDDREAGR